MIIINADDWGRSVDETDAALTCYEHGRITSVTAMVFMADSERAAGIALARSIPTGLHINLTQPFSGRVQDQSLRRDQNRIARFLNRNRYMLLLYNPFLGRAFRRVFQAQLNEFRRLYRQAPSHYDGHQHMHLCANMLVASPIPKGEKVRRSFSFGPEDKGLVNRGYRAAIDRWLSSRYRLADYFFALAQNLRAERLTKVAELAKQNVVELMTHPANREEFQKLFSDDFHAVVGELEARTYASL
jgi:predicted glycoside hydrolase/deacetylase ChbG (UPF0249 family)